jgi:hypothetical protein
MSLSEDERRELRELYAADDRLRAENEEWFARTKQPVGGPPMHETADAGIMYRDGGSRVLQGAPAPAPEPEPSYEVCGFNAVQLDGLAQVVAELQREFEQDIERMRQHILQTIVRLVMPGERAEETFYALRDRVARIEGQMERAMSNHVADMEKRIERRLSEATDNVLELPKNFWKRGDAA